MDSLQMLEKLARQMEREKRLHSPAPPAEPKELWPVYFLDPLRPRLSPVAYLVWNSLLLRTDPESRIASVTWREIKYLTGLRSNQSVQRAIAELARLGYIIPSTFPTGHCQPRNYKIPKHITPTCYSHPEVERLRREADRPHRRRHQRDAGPDAGTFPSVRALEKTILQEEKIGERQPAAPESPPLPDLPPLPNLDEKIEKASKEVDQLLKMMNQK
jgi:hypothetical protein